MKKRLDVLLVERGLAESRSQAQALVLAGRVRGHAKPGEQVDEAAALELTEPPRYVSRGGEKLANALDAFEVDPRGLDEFADDAAVDARVADDALRRLRSAGLELRLD